MTVTTAATIAPVAGQDAAQISQNLFEHIASQASKGTAGVGPEQIGANLMERLNGFIERSQRFNESAEVSSGSEVRPSASLEPPVATESGRLGTGEMDRLIASLSQVFDYSIETQMVVRGATQISGSANTLMRGQ